MDLVKLDDKDAKILKILLDDSRTSLTEIAEHCKITVGAVRMRLLRLKRLGVIKSEIMLVNPHSLGYKCVADLGITTTLENEAEVAEFLKGKSYRANVVGPFAKYNVFAVVVFKNIHELSCIVEDLESHPHVKRVETMIWAEAVSMEHMENLIFKPMQRNGKETSKKPVSFSLEEAKIDKIDRQIARILAQNARTPFRKIALQLKISTKNVIQRFKRLKGNVLTISTLSVDLKKLGFNAFAFLFIRVANRSRTPEIYAQLLKVPNLVVAFKMLGQYDLNATIFVEDFQTLFEALEQVRRIPDIDLTDTYLTDTWPEWPRNLFFSLL